MLLGVCDSFEKLGTMGATSSTGTIYVTYKFRLQNLHHNIQKSYANNLRCNNWWKPISCYQKTERYYTFSTIWDVIDVSHKLNSLLAWTSFNLPEPFTE